MWYSCWKTSRLRAYVVRVRKTGDFYFFLFNFYVAWQAQNRATQTSPRRCHGREAAMPCLLQFSKSLGAAPHAFNTSGQPFTFGRTGLFVCCKAMCNLSNAVTLRGSALLACSMSRAQFAVGIPTWTRRCLQSPVTRAAGSHTAYPQSTAA